ncbi:hypothetical protein JZ751_023220 [Albula glossodonta]|uniref:Uncharacterized protein n=1 Tax=Albula glossodonta TaxID=121402 RepID=A0A8T2PIF8_9TELE|nr:hypothetical protein JZ751_023220 [Albula glossodonta]
MRNMVRMEAAEVEVRKAMRIRHLVLAVGEMAVSVTPEAIPVMATPTRTSARAKFSTKHQLWLPFLRMSRRRAVPTTRLVPMISMDPTLRIHPTDSGSKRTGTTICIVDGRNCLPKVDDLAGSDSFSRSNFDFEKQCDITPTPTEELPLYHFRCLYVSCDMGS